MDSADADNVPFSLKYEGPALVEGLMDVRDLAPALLAFGDLCDQANRELYGDESRIDVKLRTVAPGSVTVALLIWATTGGGLGLLGYLASNADKATKVLDLVKSGFGLAKALKGDKSKTTLEDAISHIVVEHHHTIEFGEHLRKFVQNPRAQADMSSVTGPLRVPGVDRLRLIQSNSEEESVESEEVDYIDALPDLEAVAAEIETPPDSVSTVEKYYKVITTSLLPTRKWRITDGSPNEAISVRVADPDILKHAAEGTLGVEVGFFIKARIRSESRFVDNELKTTHFLEAILAIRPPNKPHEPGPGLF